MWNFCTINSKVYCDSFVSFGVKVLKLWKQLYAAFPDISRRQDAWPGAWCFAASFLCVSYGNKNCIQVIWRRLLPVSYPYFIHISSWSPSVEVHSSPFSRNFFPTLHPQSQCGPSISYFPPTGTVTVWTQSFLLPTLQAQSQCGPSLSYFPPYRHSHRVDPVFLTSHATGNVIEWTQSFLLPTPRAQS